MTAVSTRLGLGATVPIEGGAEERDDNDDSCGMLRFSPMTHSAGRTLVHNGSFGACQLPQRLSQTSCSLWVVIQAARGIPVVRGCACRCVRVTFGYWRSGGVSVCCATAAQHETSTVARLEWRTKWDDDEGKMRKDGGS